MSTLNNGFDEVPKHPSPALFQNTASLCGQNRTHTYVQPAASTIVCDEPNQEIVLLISGESWTTNVCHYVGHDYESRFSIAYELTAL
jgi:hypothetical protein